MSTVREMAHCEDNSAPTSKSSSYTQTSDSDYNDDFNDCGDAFYNETSQYVIYERLQKESLLVRDKICNIQLSLEGLLIALSGQHKTAMTIQLGEDDEPETEKEIKRREVRVSEFKARFRRNYIYPLQIEIDRGIQQLNCDFVSTELTTFSLSILRSLEKAHMQAFRALQVFQQQSRMLYELLSDSVLLEDLFIQLIRMTEVSTALGIQHEGLVLQCHSIKSKLIEKAKNNKASSEKLAVSTPPNKQKTVSVGNRHQPPTSKNKSKNRTIGTNTKDKLKDKNVPLQVSKRRELPKDSSEQSQQRQPLNIKVVMMQHVESSQTVLNNVQEAGTQTMCLPSAPGVPDLNCSQATLPSITFPRNLQAEGKSENAVETAKAIDNSFSQHLQKAVLERLADDENQDINQLIEQILREEFL